MSKVGVVIPAGGKGVRFGGALPKQFLVIAGKSILEWTIRKFDGCRSVDEIVVVAPTQYIERVRKIVKRGQLSKVFSVVEGGTERQDSVWNGLNAFSVRPEIVLVHDAVRPFVDRKIITRVVHEVEKYGSAVVGVPVKDTIKVVGPDLFCVKTPDRSNLWGVQTPQGFKYDILRRAHQAAQRRGFLGTDEASLLERMRIPVRIVQGDYFNFKITTKEDLRLAKLLIRG